MVTIRRITWLLCEGAGIRWLLPSYELRQLMRMASSRNAFEALCNWAAGERWCWKMYCGTCGHMWMRYGLMEIAKGVHPDSSAWRVSGDRNDLMRGKPAYDLGPLPPLDGWPMAIQEGLSAVLVTARLRNISAASSFPDWLGFLGLALHYTEDAERLSRVVTQSWAPQLVSFLPTGSDASKLMIELLGQQNGVLTWQMLECVETGMLPES